ncbi:MAG: ABC transporter substrate-binding protein [Candidatus Fimenecus sp.]
MRRKALGGLALLLTFVLLFCSCTGGGEPTENEENLSNAGNETVQPLSVSLPYYESDSLNPYFAVSTENRALASLFCMPLYRVNADYSAKAVLAETIDGGGTSYTVTLKNAVFSSGKSVTAADVVYSFNLAKNSAWYGTRLANVQSATAQGNTVVFVLTSPEPYFENLLTFPVVQNGTADSADAVPVGSGAFILSADGTVTENPHGSRGAVQTVQLVHIKDANNLGNALEIGNIDFVFDDFADGNYTRIVAQNTFVTMNNLVYLGINCTVGALTSAAVRTAIYYAADKDNVAASAYRGCAESAALPFHPAFCKAQGLSDGQTAADTARASEILGKIGYNRYDKNGHLTNGQNTLEMTILVNGTNGFRLSAAYALAENLNAAGFSVTVENVTDEVYSARIASGAFTLYIGEVKLSENLSLAPFFGGAASAGADTALPVHAVYTAFAAGELSLPEFANAFLDDMPFVPLCYRAGLAAYSRGITPDFSSAAYEIYGDITLWTAA